VFVFVKLILLDLTAQFLRKLLRTALTIAMTMAFVILTLENAIVKKVFQE
jgi:hypothetical protein